jgi:hypothetical protein
MDKLHPIANSFESIVERPVSRRDGPLSEIENQNVVKTHLGSSKRTSSLLSVGSILLGSHIWIPFSPDTPRPGDKYSALRTYIGWPTIRCT